MSPAEVNMPNKNVNMGLSLAHAGEHLLIENDSSLDWD